MNIKDKLSEIDAKFAGTYKKELLDIWLYLHQIEKPRPILQVKLLHPEAKVPTRGSAGAIGWDLYTTETNPRIHGHERLAFAIGLSVAVPHGYYARIAPRSGLAARMGIDVLAGVIDEDYRGEIIVILLNTGKDEVVIDLSKPIAQLILERADPGVLFVVSELADTERGSGGFGSTDSSTDKGAKL